MNTQLTFDAWWDTYLPDTDEDGCVSRLYETYGDDLETVRKADPHTVWTVVNADYEHDYILNGFHVVNRVGFFLTTGRWNEGDDIEVHITEGNNQ